MSTISDVAKLAKVSTNTVSRLMNGAENAHPDTHSNFQAHSLHSGTLALAIPEFTKYYWTTLARGRQRPTIC